MKPERYKIFDNGIWIPLEELQRLCDALDEEQDAERKKKNHRGASILFGRALSYADLVLMVEDAPKVPQKTIHENEWRWGKTITIVSHLGAGMVTLSFAKDNPGVCFLSSLSVIPNMRRKGVATFLMEEAERLCREMNIFRIDLKSVMIGFVMDFYHKLGFEDNEETDGLMCMFKMLK